MPTDLTLYGLESELSALITTEEVTLEDQQQHLAILREIAERTEQAIAKRDSCIRMARHLELQQTNIDAELTRLKALKAEYARSEERLKKYLTFIIEDFVERPKRGPRKLEGTIGVIRLAGQAPALAIEDEQQIPTRYKNVTVTMDADDWLRWAPDPMIARARNVEYSIKKAEIKEAIKAGGEVPGADLPMESFRLEVK